MDGPDLSHLLDDPRPEKPSREVLDGIVLRRRRIQARRARAAAVLGLVVALAGAGVGVGLSRQGGGTVSALSKHPSQLPTMSNRISASAPSPASRGSAPPGLGWVETGSGVTPSVNVVSPATAKASPGSASSGQLRVMSTSAGPAQSLCSVWNCSLYSPYGSTSAARLRRLFTRTSDGITVRAFTAVWVPAPLELVPISSGSGSTPVTATGTGTANSVPTPSAGALPESCAITRALVVEVSDAGAVGVVTVPLGPAVARPMDVLADQVVGVAERSPIAVVVAHTTGQTRVVRADFAGGGKDVVAVVDKWAVLVHKSAAEKAGRTGSQGSATSGRATVYALSGTGVVLEQADLPGAGALAMAVGECSGVSGGLHKASAGSRASSSPAPPG